MAEENRREKIEDRIDRLEVFCQKYPVLWVNRNGKIKGHWNFKFLENYRKLEETKEESEKREKIFNSIINAFKLSEIESYEHLREVKEELVFSILTYDYLKRRKNDDKLDEKTCKRLKEAGVGGVFGFATEIENLINKYGMEEYIAKKILEDFGTIDRFRKQYIESLISGEGSSDNRFLIKAFDISSPDFIYREDGWGKIADSIGWGIAFGDVGDSKGLRKEINVLLESLSPRERQIVNLYFGLESGKPLSKNELSEYLHVSNWTIGHNVNNAMVKLLQASRNVKVRNNSIQLRDETHERFIRSFFEVHDVFFDYEKFELEENKAKELHTIYIGDIQKKELKIQKAIHELAIYHLSKERANDKLMRFTAKTRIIKELYRRFGIKDYETKVKIDSIVEKKLHKENDNKSIKIQESNLSVRSKNLLAQYGIVTVKDLIKKNSNDIKTIKGIGVGSYNEIVEFINSFGYSFADLNPENEMNSVISFNGYEFIYNKKELSEFIGRGAELIVSISNLELSPRAYNILRRLGIEKLGEILVYPEKELKKNIGKKSLEEIINKVHSLGYQLNYEEAIVNFENDEEIICTEEVAAQEDEINEILEGTLKELQYAYKGLEERTQELKELRDKVWEEYERLTFSTKNKAEVMNFHKEFGEKARELLIEEQRLGRLKPAIEERIKDFEH